MAYPDNTEITCQQTYESNNRCDSTIDIRTDAVVLLYQRVGGGPAVRRFGEITVCVVLQGLSTIEATFT